MSGKKQKHAKAGRPVGTGIYDTRLPEVRMSSQQLLACRESAKSSNQSLSSWIRSCLAVHQTSSIEN